MMRVLRARVLGCCLVAEACSHAPRTQGSAGDVADWARGAGHRIQPDASLSARLLTVAADASAQRVGECFEAATSFVPAPRDARVFFVVRGQIAVGDIDARTSPLPARWELGEAPPSFSALLAARARGTDVELVAEGHVGDAGDEVYYVLQIDPTGRIVGAASAAGRPEFASRATFLAAFTGTRCREGDRDCLRYSSYRGETDVAIEPVDGAVRERLLALEYEVLDLTWCPGQDRSLLALVPCPPG